MRFLFDQNISHRILKLLPEKYAHSTTIKKEHLTNASDKRIWDFAKLYEYTIVTQDSDFNDLNSLFGFPPKIIWIRTGNLKTSEIVDALIRHSNKIELFIKDKKHGCFEINSL
jgi:predicted nuclease of predicted toxin-antitoxin system